LAHTVCEFTLTVGRGLIVTLTFWPPTLAIPHDAVTTQFSVTALPTPAV
jgi:hypothetical protein